MCQHPLLFFLPQSNIPSIWEQGRAHGVGATARLPPAPLTGCWGCLLPKHFTYGEMGLV